MPEPGRDPGPALGYYKEDTYRIAAAVRQVEATSRNNPALSPRTAVIAGGLYYARTKTGGFAAGSTSSPSSTTVTLLVKGTGDALVDGTTSPWSTTRRGRSRAGSCSTSSPGTASSASSPGTANPMYMCPSCCATSTCSTCGCACGRFNDCTFTPMLDAVFGIGSGTSNATGMVTAVPVSVAGSGYFGSSDPAVTIAAPPGSGTTATATAVRSSSVVTALTKTASGSGYEVVPALTVTGGAGGSGCTGHVTLAATTVDRAVIVLRGDGYAGPPTVTVSGGGGTGATMAAVMGADTAPVSAGGSGYVAGDLLTLVGGTGTAATLTVTSVGGGGAVVAAAVTSRGSTRRPARTRWARPAGPARGRRSR
jgi:hypothetical protein